MHHKLGKDAVTFFALLVFATLSPQANAQSSVSGIVNFLSAGNPTTNEPRKVKQVLYVQLSGTNANEGCTFSGTYKADDLQGNFDSMLLLLNSAFIDGSNVTLLLDGCIVDDNSTAGGMSTRPRVVTVQLGVFN